MPSAQGAPSFHDQFVAAGLQLAPSADARRAAAMLHMHFGEIETAGDGSTRHYHNTPHFRFIAEAGRVEKAGVPSLVTLFETHGLTRHLPIVRAIIMRAGANHDLVYIPVDADIPDAYRALLAPYLHVEGKNIVLNDSPSVPPDQRALYDMVLHLFDKQPGAMLSPFTGQNELASALIAALRGQEIGIEPKHLLAEAAMIEGTVPFGDVERFHRLASRLAEANQALPEAQRMDAQEIDAVMFGAVQLANRDVEGFRRDWAFFNEQGKALLREEAARYDTLEGFAQACQRKIGFFRHLLIPDEPDHVTRLFHGYKNFPDIEMRRKWDKAAKANIETRIAETEKLLAATVYLTAKGLIQGDADIRTRPLDTEAEALGETPPVVAEIAERIFSSGLEKESQRRLLANRLKPLLGAGGKGDLPADAEAARALLMVVPDSLAGALERNIPSRIGCRGRTQQVISER